MQGKSALTSAKKGYPQRLAEAEASYSTIPNQFEFTGLGHVSQSERLDSTNLVPLPKNIFSISNHVP